MWNVRSSKEPPNLQHYSFAQAVCCIVKLPLFMHLSAEHLVNRVYRWPDLPGICYFRESRDHNHDIYQQYYITCSKFETDRQFCFWDIALFVCHCASYWTREITVQMRCYTRARSLCVHVLRVHVSWVLAGLLDLSKRASESRQK